MLFFASKSSVFKRTTNHRPSWAIWEHGWNWRKNIDQQEWMPPKVTETSMYFAHCLSVVALCSVSTSEKPDVHRARPMYTLRCWTTEQGETTNYHSNTLQQRHLHIRVRSGCTAQAGRWTSSKSENSLSPSLASLPLPCSSISRHELKQRQLSSTKVTQIYPRDWSKRVGMFH